jgi:hypothetical protein
LPLSQTTMGFTSGLVRVPSLDTAAILQKSKPH